VHEWAIMGEFSNSQESPRVREALLSAIHGGGAFRHFKETIRRFHIEEAWYAYRAAALRQIAIDWCEQNGVPYREDWSARYRLRTGLRSAVLRTLGSSPTKNRNNAGSPGLF
jgi:hypothetical protein